MNEKERCYVIGVSDNQLVDNLYVSGRYNTLREARYYFFSLCSLLLDRANIDIELKECTSSSVKVVYKISI